MDKSKTSRRRRDRNPKDSEASKGKHSGRRGKKHRKQSQKLAKQARVNEREANEEMQKRLALIAKIKPVIAELCSRSRNGVVVPHDCKDSDQIILHEMYCPDGLVRNGLVDVDEVIITHVIPWAEMTSHTLKQFRKKRFRPFRMANILQIIANKL